MGAGTDALVGFMVDVHRASIDQGHMIRCWVIEANRADFLSMRAYRRFKDVYPHVEVIAPHTQKNKTDEFVGIEAVLKPRYRAGQKRLPWKGLEARNVLQRFIKELTRYPNIKQDDLVLSDWFGESHLDQIIAAGAEPSPIVHTSKLAPYLEKQHASCHWIGAAGRTSLRVTTRCLRPSCPTARVVYPGYWREWTMTFDVGMIRF